MLAPSLCRFHARCEDGEFDTFCSLPEQYARACFRATSYHACIFNSMSMFTPKAFSTRKAISGESEVLPLSGVKRCPVDIEYLGSLRDAETQFI